MPYTFGAGTSDRMSFPTAQAESTSRCTLMYGWWYPTTLTAGRCLVDHAGSPILIDTTTNQLQINQFYSTTSEVLTTGNVGLATNAWSFIAIMKSPANAGGAYRVWAGNEVVPPAEVSVSVTTARVGSVTGSSDAILCNTTTATVAFQGDCAEFGYVTADTATKHAPFFLGASGTITNDEADFAYRRFVLPAWQGKFDIRSFAGDTGSYDSMRVILDTLPACERFQRFDATTQPVAAAGFTGATVSKNGHPRPPISSQLFAHNRRR